MSFDLQLEGKRAVVTGGTKGLGAALVQSLQDAGVQVMTTARSAPEKPLECVTYVQTDLTTAEGVETLSHAQALRDLGCDGLQGYGIAMPMPLQDLTAWMRAWDPPPECVALAAVRADGHPR